MYTLLEPGDAEAVVEALEGLAGAADAPVTVGAHEALAAGPVQVVLAAAVVARALGARLQEKLYDSMLRFETLFSKSCIW